MNIRRFESYPRLSTALTITFLLCGVLLVLLLLSKISQHILQFEDRVQTELVETGADGVSLVLNRSFELVWEDLDVIMQTIPMENPDEVRRTIQAHVSVRDSVAWAAMVNLEGRIAVSSNRRGEGRDVQQSAWFKKSLSAGKMHYFEPMNEFTNGATLVTARSVKNLDGNLTGVIVVALNSNWIQKLTVEAADQLHVEVAIFDTKGDTIVQPKNSDISQSVQQSILGYLARQQVTGLKPQVMRESDHILTVHPYFVSTSDHFLDWHLFTAAPSAVANGSVASFADELLFWVISAFTLATLIPIILVKHFVKPIEKLAHSAGLMADGKFEFPEERCFTREAALLSASLARLQTQLRNGEVLNEEDSPPDANGNVHRLQSPTQTGLMRRLSRIGQ